MTISFPRIFRAFPAFLVVVAVFSSGFTGGFALKAQGPAKEPSASPQDAASLPEHRPLPKTLRILSYNIHAGIGMDKRLDLPRLAETIKKQTPDFVLLQEVDRNTARTGGVDQAATLGELTGMHAVFGKAIDLPPGEYGLAILSRFPVESHEVLSLPRADEGEKRAVLRVRVVFTGGKPLDVLCTHFCHMNRESRKMQAAKINEHFAGDGATILGGDLNETPGSDGIDLLDGKWTRACGDEPTFPAPEPRHKIDYVFFRDGGGLKFSRQESTVPVEEVASDHRPVLVALEVSEKSP